MSARASGAETSDKTVSWLGTLGAGLGLVSILAVAMIGVTSLTAFDPPEWVRVGTLGAFVISWLASVIVDVPGLRTRSRAAAVAGLGLCAFALVAMVILLAVAR